jgi:hypothetical protein
VVPTEVPPNWMTYRSPVESGVLNCDCRKLCTKKRRITFLRIELAFSGTSCWAWPGLPIKRKSSHPGHNQLLPRKGVLLS